MARSGGLKPTFEIRKVDAVSVPFQSGAVYPLFEGAVRTRFDLGGDWRSRRFRADHGLTMADRGAGGRSLSAALEREGHYFQRPDSPERDWQAGPVPGAVNRMLPDGPETYEDGVLYRRRFQPPLELTLARSRLVFMAANYVADVWLNGRYLGHHEGGYTAFAFLLAPGDLRAGENLLAVRVDNPPWGTRTDLVPAGPCPWVNATGLTGEVYIESLPESGIERLDLVPLADLSGFEARAAIRTTRVREVTVRWQVRPLRAMAAPSGPSGPAERPVFGPACELAVAGPSRLVAGSQGITAGRWQIQIRGAEPWFPARPTLYQIEMQVASPGQGSPDQVAIQTGMRVVAADRQGHLTVNGHRLPLLGAAYHEDPAAPADLTPAAIRRDLAIAQRLGLNLLRTPYPCRPAVYRAADQAGIMVFAEPPLAGFGRGEFASQAVRGVALQSWREMVWRDFNRPSIILWGGASMGAGDPCPELRTAFLETLRSELQETMRDGRLLAQLASGAPPAPADPSQLACQVAGYDLAGRTGARPLGEFLAEAGRFLQGRPVLLAGGSSGLPPPEPAFWQRWLRRAPDAPPPPGDAAQAEEFAALAAALEGALARSDGGPPDGLIWRALVDHHVHGGQIEPGLVRMDRERVGPVAGLLRELAHRLAQGEPAPAE